jgi:hypothetical protein
MVTNYAMPKEVFANKSYTISKNDAFHSLVGHSYTEVMLMNAKTFELYVRPISKGEKGRKFDDENDDEH